MQAAEILFALFVFSLVATISASSKKDRVLTLNEKLDKVPKKSKPFKRVVREKTETTRSLDDDGIEQLRLVSEIIAPIPDHLFRLYTPPMNPKYLKSEI